jgi:hypothetical protein
MFRYISFAKLKYLIFLNGWSTSLPRCSRNSAATRCDLLLLQRLDSEVLLHRNIFPLSLTLQYFSVIVVGPCAATLCAPRLASSRLLMAAGVLGERSGDLGQRMAA